MTLAEKLQFSVFGVWLSISIREDCKKQGLILHIFKRAYHRPGIVMENGTDAYFRNRREE